MVATMVVTCKGRLHHLRQTLDSMLCQTCDFPFDVLVIDYGCPDGTFSFCRGLAHPRLKAIRVLENTLPFNLSRARNIGAVNSGATIFCFLDADCYISKDWLRVLTFSIREGKADAVIRGPRSNGPGFGGICAVQRNLFHHVRGYDESMQGWGFEDVDFYQRLQRSGHRINSWHGIKRFVSPIRHGNAERVMYYNEKHRWQSHGENQRRASAGSVKANPTGYGRSRIETFPETTISP